MSAPAALIVSTRLRPPNALGPDRIVRLASEAGFDGIVADSSVGRDLLRALAATALKTGVPVMAAACPLGESALGKDKRLPDLGASEDAEERRAAVKLGIATLAWGQQLGIGYYAVELGAVPLRSREAEVRLGFARREMEPGERGAKALARALAERKARGQAIFDACRAGLEPMLAEAARRNTTLVVQLAQSPWQQPTPREAHLLLQEFRGGPLAIVYAPARRAILQDLGLGGVPQRWRDLAAAAALVEVADRVGLDGPLTLGTGELEVELPAELSMTASFVVTGPLDSTFAEIMRARRRADQFRNRPAPAAKTDDAASPS